MTRKQHKRRHRQKRRRRQLNLLRTSKEAGGSKVATTPEGRVGVVKEAEEAGGKKKWVAWVAGITGIAVASSDSGAMVRGEDMVIRGKAIGAKGFSGEGTGAKS